MASSCHWSSESFIKPQKDGNMSRDPAQYAAVLTHMEHIATTSTNSDAKGRAKFIIKAMKTVSFVCFCHFLADLFDVLSKLSVQFQRNELTLPCAVSLLEETVSNITLLCKQPVLGGRHHTFLSNLQTCNGSFMFQGIILSGDDSGLSPVEITHTDGVGAQIKRATDLCLSRLKQRFNIMLQTSDINKTVLAPCGPNQAIKDFLVFNPDAWPSNQCDLLDFGQQPIERLVKWFQPLLESKGCCIPAIAPQWVSLKILVSTQFKDKSYEDLWAILLTKPPYKEDLRDVLHLLHLPISAAQCERAISAQNRIRNDSRSCLGEHWKN